MQNLAGLRDRLSDETKDMRLNLSNVLKGDLLNAEQRWTIALACAYFLRAGELAEGMVADATDTMTDDAKSDAKAAAAIMGMNTVYYRFRHMIGKESYGQRRAQLRMNRMVRPATSKTMFELCSLACAALAGCEACMQAHESSILEQGLSEDHVHEVVRVAAAVQGFVIALDAESTVPGGVKG